jgi:hypothetical protein
MIGLGYVGDRIGKMAEGKLDFFVEKMLPFEFDNERIYFAQDSNKVLPMFAL